MQYHGHCPSATPWSTLQQCVVSHRLCYECVRVISNRYQNEVSVGKAIKASGTSRAEVFLTTKVNGPDHGYRGAIQSVQNSLEDLGVDYLDLVLIHSPYGAPPADTDAISLSSAGGRLVETYDGLLEMQRRGLVRSVGVSNFGVKHLQALESHGRPRPAVNQIEIHPLIYQESSPIPSPISLLNDALIPRRDRSARPSSRTAERLVSPSQPMGACSSAARRD